MELYSGCGNTFVICEYLESKDHSDYARMICKDEIDGFIMVKTNPLEMILYNQDGSIATMCGNGIRCFIQYCYNHKLICEMENIVLTLSGKIYTKIVNISLFTVYVRMNTPLFTYIDNRVYLNEPIVVNNHIYKISIVHTGVWHGIIIPNNYLEAVEDAFSIRSLPIFKDNLNLDIVVLNDDIYVKTYERGVGFTKACGTGAIATFIILKQLKLITDDEIVIKTDGGDIIAGINKNEFYILGSSRYLKKL